MDNQSIKDAEEFAALLGTKFTPSLPEEAPSLIEEGLSRDNRNLAEITDKYEKMGFRVWFNFNGEIVKVEGK